ncbi:MAG: hypothetical protein HUJ72_12960 [Blautia sp.]|nr:hypothetical protein [Blautia sp.]
MKLYKKHRLLSLFMASFLIVAVTGIITYGKMIDEVSVTNPFVFGDINIDLKEYEICEEKEVSYQNNKIVMPGDTISKIPRITNYANDCWVRVKLLFQNPGEELKGLSEKDIIGISEEWIKIGDYYYLMRRLTRGESVDLFTHLRIPASWNQSYENQHLSLEIKAEAIQAKNFKPDFTTDKPWGDEEIQICVHENNGTVLGKREELNLQLEFDGDAGKLFTVPDNFFCNFDEMMPGDKLEDSVSIENDSDMDIKIMFRAELPDATIAQKELLSKIGFKMYLGDQLIYIGNLAGNSLMKDHILCKVSANQKSDLKFKLTVPAELDNTYALRNSSVRWIFSVSREEVTPVPSLSNPGNSQFVSQSYTTGSVRTGDDTNIIVYITILLSSIILITYPVIRKGRKEKDS